MWTNESKNNSFFVHTIRELQGNDLMSQKFVDLNKPLHSNWVGLPKLISQLVTNDKLFNSFHKQYH
jgi:hypothetical protein